MGTLADPANAIAALGQFDPWAFLAAFWYLIVLEAPRYLVAGLVCAAVWPIRQRRRPELLRPQTISVLIPCHNCAPGMRRTVASLEEQTRPPLEIVVVDDGSTDAVALAARHLYTSKSITAVVATGLRGGKSSALNAGLAHCTGEIIVAADADTTFDRDALERIIEPLNDPKIGAVGGNIGVGNAHEGVLTALQAVEYTIGISLGRRISGMLGIDPIVSGAFAAFRREALESIGGWEAGSGEDADVALKLQRAGWELSFAPDAWALTDVPTAVTSLWRQRVRWERDLLRLYLRKFRFLLNPRFSSFSIRIAASTIDVVMFSIALPCAVIVYIVWILVEYGDLATSVLVTAAIVFGVLGTFTFTLAALTSGRGTLIWLRLLPFACAYGLYTILMMHPLRIYAFLGELIFDRSYQCSFVPHKVLKQLPRF